MKDSTLIDISTIIAIIGLLILYFLLPLIEPGVLSQKTKEGDYTKVKGTVSNLQAGEQLTKFTITRPQRLNIIVFDYFYIKDGEEVNIKGKLQNNEIIASEIEVEE